MSLLGEKCLHLDHSNVSPIIFVHAFMLLGMHLCCPAKKEYFIYIVGTVYKAVSKSPWCPIGYRTAHAVAHFLAPSPLTSLFSQKGAA